MEKADSHFPFARHALTDAIKIWCLPDSSDAPTEGRLIQCLTDFGDSLAMTQRNPKLSVLLSCAAWTRHEESKLSLIAPLYQDAPRSTFDVGSVFQASMTHCQTFPPMS